MKLSIQFKFLHVMGQMYPIVFDTLISSWPFLMSLVAHKGHVTGSLLSILDGEVFAVRHENVVMLKQ